MQVHYKNPHTVVRYVFYINLVIDLAGDTTIAHQKYSQLLQMLFFGMCPVWFKLTLHNQVQSVFSIVQVYQEVY